MSILNFHPNIDFSLAVKPDLIFKKTQANNKRFTVVSASNGCNQSTRVDEIIECCRLLSHFPMMTSSPKKLLPPPSR
jgi:hypothetical protein